MTGNFETAKLSDVNFKRISKMVYDLARINLHSGKKEMVKSRLLKRLRALSLNDFSQYLKYIDNDCSGREIVTMVDILTTNKTDFFREEHHFNFLRNNVLPNINKSKIRIWSAGCSSGEEPFSIAILLKEEIKDLILKDIRILATDISKTMISMAREGIFNSDKIINMNPEIVQKYFTYSKNNSQIQYILKNDIRKMVEFAELNLANKWPMQGPFDVIFCRNVMIYFDADTRKKLIERFWNMLDDGGYLFVGHAEVISGFSDKFKFVQPAIYKTIHN